MTSTHTTIYPHNRRPGRVRRRFVTAVMTACVLLASSCTSGGPSDSSSADSDPSTPSAPPSPPVFSQTFTGPVDGEPATIEVSANPSEKRFRKGNIGISFESTELADPRLDPDRSNLDELLGHLGDPALRFGGNELDRRVFWTSTGERPTRPEHVVVTPHDFTRLKKLLDATGSTVTVGIPLGTYDPQRGADMAVHAVDILGDSLVGLAIGNEPNGYTIEDVPNGAVRDQGWNTEVYVDQLGAYAEAIRAKRPDAPIIGPDVYQGEWMDAFAEADVENTTALSQHWYQLYECSSTAVPGRGPQAENLIDPLARRSAKKILGIGANKAAEAGLPLWLEETGTTSCPGTNNTSRTHASALWAVDHSLHAATIGVERMAMHSMLGACEGGAPMSLICDPAQFGSTSASFAGRPHFSAMRLLVPSTGGTFHGTKVQGGGNMRAYAVSKGDGEIMVTTIINANDARASGGNPVTLKTPQGFVVDKVSQIHAPSNTAQDATAVIPSSPLPDQVPFSGPEAPDQVTNGGSGTSDNELDIDLAGSTATVVIMRKD